MAQVEYIDFFLLLFRQFCFFLRFLCENILLQQLSKPLTHLVDHYFCDLISIHPLNFVARPNHFPKLWFNFWERQKRKLNRCLNTSTTLILTVKKFFTHHPVWYRIYTHSAYMRGEITWVPINFLYTLPIAR